MPHELLKHTADLRMKVRAKTIVGFFFESLRGMMGVLRTNLPELTGGKIIRRVDVTASDRTALLVDFLGEALSLAQTNKEVYVNVLFKKLTDKELEAELEGVHVDRFDEDIKAVTSHEADVKKNAAGEWESTIVFDI